MVGNSPVDVTGSFKKSFPERRPKWFGHGLGGGLNDADNSLYGTPCAAERIMIRRGGVPEGYAQDPGCEGAAAEG